MSYDVYGIGNALVDTEYAVDEVFLRDQGIAKGHMTLVSAERIDALATSLEGREGAAHVGRLRREYRLCRAGLRRARVLLRGALATTRPAGTS